jgi:hypothetical protein
MSNNHLRKLALIKLPLSIEQMQKREKIKNEILTEVRKFLSFCNDPKNTKLLTCIAVMIESLRSDFIEYPRLSLSPIYLPHQKKLIRYLETLALEKFELCVKMLSTVGYN